MRNSIKIVKMPLIFTCLLLFLLYFSPYAVANSKDDDANSVSQDISIFYLVRHAEKQAGSNPHLSIAGKARAKRLADLLSDTKIEQIYSTSYNRTLQTSAPLAAKLGLNTQDYSPTHLSDFASALLEMPQTSLIVGHSNTTPELVKKLGGNPISKISEKEFNRLYILTVHKGKVIHTQLLRY
ncbi:SixA phosphatase family protein [Shewanella maritima]|uniref:SixA phosphatase family protein n=1 Tax=Shewanella maritima TaxID=2520507 RepID=UPI003735602B